MRAQSYLKSLLQEAVQRRGWKWPPKASLERPKDSGFGDLASNVALVLASQAGQKPREVAASLREELLGQGREIERIEVAGPGFLNFTFSPGFWQQTVPLVLDSEELFGKSDFGQGEPVLLEYVSANPTGPLHIGHGRGAAVGDSLARILRQTGFEVTTEYYLNDTGRQMSILGQSIWARYRSLLGREAELPAEGYQGEYIKDLAQRALSHYGEGLLELEEPEAIAACTDMGREAILEEIRSDLESFGVKHEVFFSEKSLLESGAVDRTLSMLQERGLAFESEGALWFRSTDFGDDKDRVLRKSNGELTYFASDIAYHADKLSRGFSRLIDVWGADHHGYVPRMKAAVQALGRDKDDLQVVLIQLVSLLRSGEQVAMSTRAGQFVTLAEVCSEVGVNAARFIFLSRKSDSHLDFDLDLLKQQSMDNPVYYVQYAHARIQSIFKKATERGLTGNEPRDGCLASLDTEQDLEILKAVDRFPEVLQGAARTLSPHHVSYYLLELAGMFHRYYNTHSVVNASQPEQAQGRLLLLQTIAQVLRNGLQLLGVEAPEQM